MTADELAMACAGAIYSADEGTDSYVLPRYVLPSEVRVPCDNLRRLPGFHDSGCQECQGRGWTPNLDGWVWLALCFNLEGEAPIERGGLNPGDPATSESVALDVLTRIRTALQAMGATFPQDRENVPKD